MQITSITPQKHDKNRCNIETDGRFYCGMTLETVVKNRLKVGMSVSGEELSQMQLESEKQTALDRALTHITATMKTERDVRDFLKKKGYLADVVDYVVEKMREYGFINDEAYAKSYTERAAKRKGAKLIRMELRQKGVSDEEIEGALQGVSAEQEEESAAQLLARYLRGKELGQDTLKKAYRFLLSKGFDYEIAKQALSRYGEEQEGL